MAGFFATVQLLLRAWDLIQKLIGVYKEKAGDDWDKRILADAQSYLELKTAKTPEEVKSAQRKIADSWLK